MTEQSKLPPSPGESAAFLNFLRDLMQYRYAPSRAVDATGQEYRVPASRGPSPEDMEFLTRYLPLANTLRGGFEAGMAYGKAVDTGHWQYGLEGLLPLMLAMGPPGKPGVPRAANDNFRDLAEALLSRFARVSQRAETAEIPRQFSHGLLKLPGAELLGLSNNTAYFRLPGHEGLVAINRTQPRAQWLPTREAFNARSRLFDGRLPVGLLDEVYGPELPRK